MRLARNQVSVMLVDDDRLARAAFAMMLKGDPTIAIYAQAANGE